MWSKSLHTWHTSHIFSLNFLNPIKTVTLWGCFVLSFWHGSSGGESFWHTQNLKFSNAKINNYDPGYKGCYDFGFRPKGKTLNRALVLPW